MLHLAVKEVLMLTDILDFVNTHDLIADILLSPIYHLVLFGEYFLTSKELPNTAESLIIQPSAASAGVSITE